MNNSVSTMSGKIKVKVVLLGNQSVGKSCMIQRYVKNHFDQTSNPTVGIDFLVKNVSHNNKNYRLQLWDTAGQQRFRSLIPNYLKDAKCALIVIDVTNKTSLNNAQSWLKMYNDNRTGQGCTFLIGNKIDLEYREITKQQAQKKANQLNLPYYQVSAKTGQNLQQIFYKIIQALQYKPTASNLSNIESKKNSVIKQQQKQQETQTQQSKLKKQKQKQKEKEKNNKDNNNNSVNTSVNKQQNKQKKLNTSVNKDKEKVQNDNKVVLKNQKIGTNAGKKTCC